METATVNPFYADWTFWAFVTSAIAVFLSQVPPLKHLFRKPGLSIEVYSRALFTHKVGNPNVQIHLIVENTGGRPTRLRRIELGFKRDGHDLFTLPVQNYFQNLRDTDHVIFTPRKLAPGEEWSHVANFLKFFDRTKEKEFRNAQSALRRNILSKRDLTGDENLVEADPEVVQPIINFFEREFAWLEGEYELTVRAISDDVAVERHFTFTIFETESAELRRVVHDYKYGAWVYWDPDKVPGPTVGIQLNEADA